MSALQYDAILRDWQFVDCLGGGGLKRVSGRIYSDAKGRFHDGELVTTSVVMMRIGDHVLTRNTRYLLDGPEFQQKKADIMDTKDPLTIPATVNVTLKPWKAPNFAVVSREKQSGNGDGIPLKELTVATLDTLARQWLTDLYLNAGQAMPTFVRSQLRGELE